MTVQILAISDIHGNVSAVRLLRSRERNEFDAVVVAGDIGNDQAGEILETLASFGCPVLYVYGNWDHELEYDQVFGAAREHLHLKPFQCGPYSFVGFSGVSVHWGRNPIAADLRSQVRQRHRESVERYSQCESIVASEIAQIELAYDGRIVELTAKTRDRRRSAYRANLQALERERDREIASCDRRLEQVADSQDYRAYTNELQNREREIAAMNRRAMTEVIKESDAGPQRTIVVTHERLYRTADDLAGVPLFLVGHRHGFRDSTFRGSRFVNVSVLSRGALVQPAHKRRPREADYRNTNIGNYVIIETRQEREFDVKCVAFKPDFDAWKLVGDFEVVGYPWVD